MLSFIQQVFIRQTATKCQAVKRTLRWLRLSLSLNFTYSPTRSRPGSVSQFSTARDSQGRPGWWAAGTLSTTGCHRTEKHLKSRNSDRREYPDSPGIRCSQLRGKCLQELRGEGSVLSSGSTAAGLCPTQRPHTGLPVSSSEHCGFHPKNTRDPFSLARYCSINLRNLHHLC